MKKIIVAFVSIFVLVGFIAFNNYKYNQYIDSLKDKEAPIICIIENDLEFFDTDNFDYFDYVKVVDNSGKYEVTIVDEENSRLPGDKLVHFIATDLEGNVSEADLHVVIKSTEEWNDYVANNTFNYVYRRLENDGFLEMKGHPDEEAFYLAQEFIGMEGACSEVAQAFINSYFGPGYSVFNTYAVSYEDAKPGDIIYYTDGGIGLQHYAVYLGGASALQGNINGTTVIGNVYMSHGSTPQFQRLVGIE